MKEGMSESDKYDLKLIRHIHKYVQIEIHEYYQKEPLPLRIAMQVDDLENIEDALRRAINIIEHKEVTNEN